MMFQYESSLVVITIKNNYAVLNFVKLYKIYKRKMWLQLYKEHPMETNRKLLIDNHNKQHNSDFVCKQ